MDELSLKRTIEFIGYLKNEAVAQQKALKGKHREYEDEVEITGEDPVKQFSKAIRDEGLKVNEVFGRTTNIPPELREAINWAEDFKKKKRAA